MKSISILLLYVSILISACNTTPAASNKNNQVANGSGVTADSSSATIIEAPSLSSKNVMPMDASLKAQLMEMSKESVFFDFDRSIIKQELRNTLIKHATLANAHQNIVITLEGHADERGSNEYNLKLANSRAISVRNALNQMGVPNEQIRIVNFGEEKPRLTCHEEKCWKENRRVDFIGTPGY